MLLIDVNILVLAYREDAPDHEVVRPWLENLLSSDNAFGVSSLVLSGFLRIVTHPGIFDPPSPFADALEFVEVLRSQPHYVPVEPGLRHWEIFTRLCQESAARGNLVPDAYFAAIAIESGCEWITTDRDFSRFPGLSWRAPGP